MGSIQSAMSAMGYQRAGERPSCGNCFHREVRYGQTPLSSASAGIKCKKGGFLVSNFATCEQHQPFQRVDTEVQP